MRRRSTAAEKARRLNHAREVWHEVGDASPAVGRLMQDYGIGRRQAYRDLRRARRLKGPVPIPDSTIAFTVKLSRDLVRRLRAHAEASDRTISDVVSRAIVAQLARSGERG
jgi:hypothetical protein